MDVRKYKIIGISSALFFIILFFTIIGLRLNYLKQQRDSKPKYRTQTIINDSRTYQQYWRQPSSSEFTEIGRLITQNNIRVCGEYYVKKVTSGEYVIACSPNGSDWHYFVAYTKIGKFYRASDEMVAKLTPPR